MSFEKLNLAINSENIITSKTYHNFKVIDKPFEVGDFVIPIANLSSKYRTTIQENNWLGIIWNLADLEEGRVYPIDHYDSYNLNADELVVVQPTEIAILKFIDKFALEDVNDAAVDLCFRFIKDRYPTYRSKLENVFPVCPLCGGRLNRHNSMRTEEDGVICESCYHKLYRECRKCGNSFKRDSIESREELCHVCRKREFILPYHQYYPDIKFYGNDHNKKVPYLGIELEVDDGGQSDSSAKIVVNSMNKDDDIFMYCSRDGSLAEGFEMITQPATLEYHTSIKGIYGNLFNRLHELGYCSHDTATCGLHIHFNRNFYEDNEEVYITRLLYLVEKFWDDIVLFSRRNSHRLDRYAKKVDMPSREYYRRANKAGRHDDHYYSVNIANENTIEFRMFKGTLNINTYFATLQFVNNCIIAAKEKSSEEVQRMTFDELISTREMKRYWKKRTDLGCMPNEE